jgi:RNase adaptor protein for sRNA GlmZ degradation
VLEDSAYYCVDNLPAKLLNGLIQFLAQKAMTRRSQHDVRSGATLSELPATSSQLKKAALTCTWFFRIPRPIRW